MQAQQGHARLRSLAEVGDLAALADWAVEEVVAVWSEAFGIDVGRPGFHIAAPGPSFADRPRLFLLELPGSAALSCPPGLADEVGPLVHAGGAGGLARWAAARDLTMLGPSVHAYAPAGAHFRPDARVRRLAAGDTSALQALRDAAGGEAWAEGGFEPLPECCWGFFDAEVLVAAGNMTDFAGRPADVGLVTHPDHRGRGAASALTGAMCQAAGPGLLRYRALASNLASRRVAGRLGFVDYGTNLVVRLP